jgi:two-component system cell cycle sensor histidine kinase/response regulator CckA
MDRKPTRVLLIEDSPMETHLIQDLMGKSLAERFEVEHAERLVTALQRLHERTFDVLLLDLVLPDSQGLDTFARVHAQVPDVPVVVLSGIDDEGLAAKAVGQGAQDYLVKGDVDGRTLARSIRYAIERARAEEQIRYQASLVRSISDAVVSVDMGFNIVSWNQAAEFMYGWSAEEAVGKPREEILHTEYLYQTNGEVLQHLLRAGFWRGEVVQARKDGTAINILASISLIEDSAGRPAGVVAVYRDITERVWAEQAIQQSEEKYRSLFDGSNDSIILHDIRGRIIDVNQKALNQFGYTRAEILSLTVPDLHPPGSLQASGQALETISRDGFVRFEIDFRNKNGEVFPTEVSSSLLEIAREPVIQSIVRDITERVRAEAALKEYSARLEETVQQRTQELRDAQEQLVRRERLAVLGQLAGGLGHELRGPLGAITAAAYYLGLALEPSDPEAKEALEILEREVATAESIISSLLDFARVKPPARQEVEIAAVVQKALARTIVPDDVEIVTQLDGSVPIILADPDQLKQVFGNLIRNALQAMPDGGKLTIACENSNPDWVVVHCTDTGTGIPEENLLKVFEPLFTTKAKGIGLGLALVKTLIEAHGGTLAVESELGQGTTFSVGLPSDRGDEK